MNQRFVDAATLGGVRKTADGYIVTDAFAVRTGIQLYSGSEVGLFDTPVVRVYRPESEVRDKASLSTFSHAPVTLGHPSEAVTTDNWASLAKGEVSTEATWEDNKIRLPLIVKDAAAIAAIESGTRELSAGYTCQLDFVDGVTPEGEAYDAIQRNIRVNHLAIVPRGRAGSECRIGDGEVKWGSTPITNADKEEVIMTDKLQSVVLGDKAVNVPASEAATIEMFKNDANQRLSDMETAHATEIAAKDAELATLQAKVDDAEGKVLSDADIDKRVAARADLIGDAKLVHKDVKTEGLSDADIRKAVVTAKLGDSLKRDDQPYIDARFDLLVDSAKSADPFADSIRKNGGPTVVANDHGQAEYEAGLRDAWKQKGAV